MVQHNVAVRAQAAGRALYLTLANDHKWENHVAQAKWNVDTKKDMRDDKLEALLGILETELPKENYKLQILIKY